MLTRHIIQIIFSRNVYKLFTFRVRRSRCEMYIGCGRLCLCVCLSVCCSPHYCTDPDVSWGNDRGALWLCTVGRILQSVHGFRCYDNIAPNAKCQRVLVLALCLVIVCHAFTFKVLFQRFTAMTCLCPQAPVDLHNDVLLSLAGSTSQ